MASIQKRGSEWLAEVRRRGIYKSKKFPTKAAALSWADEFERGITGDRSIVPGKSVGDAMKKYFEEVSPTKKGARWEKIRITRMLSDGLADIPLLHLNHTHIENWIKGRKVKPSSINRELNLISSILTKARVKWCWMVINPFDGLERPKDPPHRERIVTKGELSRIVETLGFKGTVITQRHYVAVAAMLAFETAMRLGEIYSLMWENVSIAHKYARLPDTKNGEARNVPLNDKAIELFNLLPKTADRVFPFNKEVAGKQYKGAMVTAEVKDATFHDLRHSALTWMADKVDMLTLAKIAGHKDPRNLLIYYNPKPSDIAGKLNG